MRPCHEVEHREFVAPKREKRDFARSSFVIALRQIVAKSQ
jgi:hypothetical protein